MLFLLSLSLQPAKFVYCFIMFQTIIWLSILTTGLMTAVLAPISNIIAYYCAYVPFSPTLLVRSMFYKKIPMEVSIADTASGRRHSIEAQLLDHFEHFDPYSPLSVRS